MFVTGIACCTILNIDDHKILAQQRYIGKFAIKYSIVW
jgi:hypothetical protein